MKFVRYFTIFAKSLRQPLAFLQAVMSINTSINYTRFQRYTRSKKTRVLKLNFLTRETRTHIL